MMWAATAAVFLGLFLLIHLALPARTVSKKRLGIEREKAKLSKSISGALGVERERRLARALSLADIETEPGQFVLRVLVGSVLLAILGSVLDPIMGLVFLLVPGFLTRLWVNYRGGKRQAKFAEQLPDFLQALTMSLRSGFALRQAIDTALEEAEDPIRIEVGRALDQTRMGRDLSDALRSLSKRMNSADLEWVVGAIDINRETGGNLSEILSTVNGTIRERQRIGRKIKTFTAEGRLSAKTLTVLPLALGLWQWRAHPDGFDVLLHGVGLMVLLGCLGLMILGWFWIRRIVTIKL